MIAISNSPGRFMALSGSNHHISQCVQELRPVEAQFSNQTARRAGGCFFLYGTWWIREDLYTFLKNSYRSCPKFCSAFSVKWKIKQLKWRILSKCSCSSNSVLSGPDPFRFISLGLRNPQIMTFFRGQPHVLSVLKPCSGWLLMERAGVCLQLAEQRTSKGDQVGCLAWDCLPSLTALSFPQLQADFCPCMRHQICTPSRSRHTYSCKIYSLCLIPDVTLAQYPGHIHSPLELAFNLFILPAPRDFFPPLWRHKRLA